MALNSQSGAYFSRRGRKGAIKDHNFVKFGVVITLRIRRVDALGTKVDRRTDSFE